MKKVAIDKICSVTKNLALKHIETVLDKHPAVRESAVIAIAAVALVLLTALATYSPGDPGFSFTGSGTVQNRIGPFGAWLADVLFFLFGRPAFLFPLMLGSAAEGPSPPSLPAL